MIQRALPRKTGRMFFLALDKSAKNGEDDLFAECSAVEQRSERAEGRRRSTRKASRRRPE
jgi:hypothetical protein